MKLKSILLVTLSMVGLLLPVTSFAVGPTPAPLEVRLGLPKSPTNQNSLKLTFVALQIGGVEKIAVECYKKSPSDGNYVKFEDLSLITGGNTDYCTVNNNILNSVGTYRFKVIAKTSLETKESNEAIVDYNTSGPGTPNNYSKEKINSCEYKIKFKTADDGKTTNVQLFRSDTYNISLDSGNILASQNIGSNQEGQFIVGGPNCNIEYYFVIRAVDNAGNVSGTTGDSITTTTYTTNTSSTTTTATTTQGALLTAEGSQVTEGTPAEGTTITPIEGTGASSTESATPEILGTETTKYSNLKWAILATVAFIIFQLLSRKKRA